MKSETGAVLTKISAILNFVFSGIIFLIGVLSAIGLSLFQETPFFLSIRVNMMLIFLLIALVILALGFVLLNISKKMQNSKTVKNASIWAIVIGALTFSSISGILALVGGIIGIIDSDKKK